MEDRHVGSHAGIPFAQVIELQEREITVYRGCAGAALYVPVWRADLIVRCSTVLRAAALFMIRGILWINVLHRMILWISVLCRFIRGVWFLQADCMIWCIILRRIGLSRIILYQIGLSCIILSRISLSCIILRHISLSCISLSRTILCIHGVVLRAVTRHAVIWCVCHTVVFVHICSLPRYFCLFQNSIS